MRLLILMTMIGGAVATRALHPRAQTDEKKPATPAERPYGIAKRVPWTTSKLTGAPEPPPPYRIERAFANLTFKEPLHMIRAPGWNRWFVLEQAGRIYSFANDENVAKADPFFDLTKELRSWDPAGKVKGVGAVYGLVFHPRFERNRYCYICYVLDSKNKGEQLPDGTRVSRFTVISPADGGDKGGVPRIDPKSEKIIITWLAGGHNGCDLQFGPDGCLFICTGDGTGPNPPDGLDTGQELSDLLSSILRIDVDRQEGGRAYAVPADNPFVKTPGARPEIWAYGFRNPWRMSFDRATGDVGDLWVGDVGWERWELVYRVKKGGNYGWSVMEGRQPVKPEGRRGPTPILPPTLDFPHSEAASITGGFVYRGKRLKGLVGAYVCGDWQTGRLWGTRFQGDRIVSHQELARGPYRVVAFAEDAEGELFFVHHQDKGTIHRLVPNEVKDTSATFPRKLSATGLFASVRDHEPAPGVVPFSINAEMWADHASTERLVALPGTSSARFYDTRVLVPGTAWPTAQVFFPKDGVLAKTLSLEMELGNPASRRRVETQILHFDGTEWRGYSYRWKEDQSDAELVPAGGLDEMLTVRDAHAPGGRRRQTWHFPGRAECLQCHNPWAGPTLGFTPAQLDREHTYGPIVDHQPRTLQHIGVIASLRRENDKDVPHAFKPAFRPVDPHDAKADLDARTRSYLHANCAHCHQLAAGGTAEIDLRFDMPLDDTKALEVRPIQGGFDIPGAQILFPGDPYRSVLYYRMAKLGPGRMPHIGSDVIDERGVRLIHDWIRRLPVRKDERLLIERLRALDEPAVLVREKQERNHRVEQLAREIAQDNGRDMANADDRCKAEEREKTDAPARAAARAAERKTTIERLLATTPAALLLVRALEENRIPESVRPQILTAAMARSDAQVRDLFERFVPDEQRVKRLGSVIRPEQILALKGDAGRGKELFFQSAGLQCVSCHRVGDAGKPLGPELTQIAKKYTREQLLESILEPSKTVAPEFVPQLVETTEGLIHTGLLVEKTTDHVVLKDAKNETIRVPAGKVSRLVPQAKSLMPELMLRDLTAEQAADLLEYLVSLK